LLRFSDPAVSRKHLKLVHRANEAFVEDLGSSNGTLLNGLAVTAPTRVNDGDVITLGNKTLTVRALSPDMPEPKTVILENEFDSDTFLDSSEGMAGDTLAVRSINSRMTVPIPRVQDLLDRQAAQASIDRRRHERVTLELRLTYVSDELEVEATTTDLSHSGVFVRTQILEPVGTKCKLTIFSEVGPPLHLRGVVRRVVSSNDRGEPVGLGIELEGLGDREKKWISIVTASPA
jgi:pSer/pThr/pTyr-binding forkhead associated (FHA) protein